jgi:hypothetical protein
MNLYQQRLNKKLLNHYLKYFKIIKIIGKQIYELKLSKK